METIRKVHSAYIQEFQTVVENDRVMRSRATVKVSFTHEQRQAPRPTPCRREGMQNHGGLA